MTSFCNGDKIEEVERFVYLGSLNIKGSQEAAGDGLDTSAENGIYMEELVYAIPNISWFYWHPT